MFATILSGHVFAENRSKLEKAYAEAFRHPPEGLLQSMLLHNTDIANQWQILTIWKSREAYDQAAAQGITGRCVQLFCDAGVTPERMCLDVVEKYLRV